MTKRSINILSLSFWGNRPKRIQALIFGDRAIILLIITDLTSAQVADWPKTVIAIQQEHPPKWRLWLRFLPVPAITTMNATCFRLLYAAMVLRALAPTIITLSFLLFPWDGM